MCFENQEVGSVPVRCAPWCLSTRISKGLLLVTGRHKSHEIANISEI